MVSTPNDIATRQLKEIWERNGQPKVVFVLNSFDCATNCGAKQQCEKLVEDYGYTPVVMCDYEKSGIIASKDLVHAEAQKTTKISELIKKGDTPANKILCPILINAFRNKVSKSYLIIGFPQDKVQINWFEQNICPFERILFFKYNEEKCNENVDAKIKKTYEQFIGNVQQNFGAYEFNGTLRTIEHDQCQTMYKQVQKAVLPQISFIIGPKASGKTTLGKAICERTNMKLINFDCFLKMNALKKKSQETQVLELINFLAQERSSRVLLEDFPKTAFQANMFVKNCQVPEHVFALKCSKDVCQERMIEWQGTPEYLPSSILGQLIREFNQNMTTMLPFLNENSQVYQINTDDLQANSFKDMCKVVEPTLVTVSFDDYPESNQRSLQIAEQLAQHDFIKIRVIDLIDEEIARGTPNGKLLSVDENNHEVITDVLKQIIYSGVQGRARFVIENFPSTVQEAKYFEDKVAQFTAAIMVTEDGTKVQQSSSKQTELNVETLFKRDHRLQTVGKFINVEEVMGSKINFGVVIGAQMSGKTTIANQLCKVANGILISMNAISEEVRKRLSTEDEPFEGDVPINEIEKDIVDLMNSQSGKRVCFIFDGFNHAKAEEFVSFIEQFGSPRFVINCQASTKCIEDRYKKKNEVDEIGEEQAEEIKQIESAQGLIDQVFSEYVDNQSKNKKNAPIMDIKLATDVSLETTFCELEKYFSPKLFLIDNRTNRSNFNELCNSAMVVQAMFISVHELIKENIESKTAIGKKLAAQRKEREIMCGKVEKAVEFQYSCAHFDLSTVLELINQTIKQKRGNSNFIIIEGLLTAYKLMNKDDTFELRPQHELELISKNIGPIRGLMVLKENGEQEISTAPKFAMEEFPEPEQPVEEVKKPENAEGEEEEQQEEDPENKKPPAFDPSKYEWTVSNNQPRNYFQSLRKIDPKNYIEGTLSSQKENWEASLVTNLSKILAECSSPDCTAICAYQMIMKY